MRKLLETTILQMQRTLKKSANGIRVPAGEKKQHDAMFQTLLQTQNVCGQIQICKTLWCLLPEKKNKVPCFQTIVSAETSRRFVDAAHMKKTANRLRCDIKTKLVRV